MKKLMFSFSFFLFLIAVGCTAKKPVIANNQAIDSGNVVQKSAYAKSDSTVGKSKYNLASKKLSSGTVTLRPQSADSKNKVLDNPLATPASEFKPQKKN